MQGIRSKTVTRSAERPWVDTSNPIFQAETKTFDYSVLVAATGVDMTHPWVRDDKRVIVPSGVPVARDDNGDERNIFPVKRTRLTAAVDDDDVDYPVANTKPFKVGDEFTIANAVASQTISAINHTTKVITLDTTLGEAGDEDEEVWTPNQDTAIGMLLDVVDLTDGEEDVILGMLVEGYVFPAVVHNSIFELTDQIIADLKAANIRFVPSTWTL